METYKVCITQVIIHHIEIDNSGKRMKYCIGNDITRDIPLNHSLSYAQNVIKYENYLTLTELNKNSTNKKCWYNGVSVLIFNTYDNYTTAELRMLE